MRLKNSIFVGVVPTILVPLAILGLAATTYVEHRYLAGVDADLARNLTQIAAAINRRLLVERDIATGLAEVPAVTRFRDGVLRPLADGMAPANAEPLRAALNEYVATFQSVRLSLDTVRILDRAGNTLVRVAGGRAAEPVFESMGPIAYVEQERHDPAFTDALRSLPTGQVGMLLMPDTVAPAASPRALPVYSATVPLADGGGRVLGYLVIDPPIGPLNRVIDVAVRQHQGQLAIAEFDNAVSGRDGLLLYDEDGGTDLWSTRARPRTVADEAPLLGTAFARASAGVIADPATGSRVYYEEFLPYPDRLTVWMLALRIDSDALTAPFRNIRIGMLLAVLAALALSLLMVGGVARRIAGPVLGLAGGLAAFARGERERRIQPRGPDELRAAGAAFNDMADTVLAAEQQRDAAVAAQYRSRQLAGLGRMTAGIAHEISNPINTILSLTTLMERQLGDDQAGLRDDIASIREECARMGGTIRAITGLSQTESGLVTRFDAADWLRGALELVERECRACDVSVDIEVAGSCMLEGELTLLQRALRNLLENAAQASPAGARVTVRLAVEDGRCVVAVHDQGPGLRDDHAEQVFDPFFTTKVDGSGLGLAISQGIVEHHGGELVLHNRPGGGAVARILLPALAASAGQADAATTTSGDS